MPKPMLHRPKVSENTDSAFSLTKTVKHDDPKEKMRIDRALRKPRSEAYLRAMHQLDAGGHVTNAAKVKDIVNQIAAELPEVKLEGFLIGIISRCYLGDPYEVHTLDLSGTIITHYKRGETLPNGMEKARSLAMMDYAFIEVYTDRCCAVSEDGSVAVVQN